MLVRTLKTVLITASLACLLGACVQQASGFRGQLPRLEQGLLALPQGQRIQVYKAQTRSAHVQGLSFVHPEHFGPDQGMFFSYPRSGTRVFCMRHTYMDLDIFFLDQRLCVIAVERDLPHELGPDGTKAAARTKPVHCRYVLEMRADSALAKQIKSGMCLKWIELDSKVQVKLKANPHNKN